MKYKFRYYLTIILIVNGFILNAQVAKLDAKSSYQDATRNERIAKTFPIIDQLYKDFALKNHFPGYAFGIVVDGQLVYKGNGAVTTTTAKPRSLLIYGH